MKNVVNGISISRIFLALSLFMFKPLSSLFYIVYIICGVSDIADGYIARKTNATSKLGEKLDSFSDLVLVFVVMKIVSPIVNLHVIYIIWIVVVIAIRCISLVIVRFKYRTLGILHTVLNKLTGLLLFFYPLTLSFEWSNNFVTLLCFMGTISAIEEVLIHLFSDELNLNQKGLIQ